MNTPMKNSVSRSKSWLGLPVLGAALLLVTACTTTEKAHLNQANVNCAFLGNECALLIPGGKDQAALRYVNPAVQWTQYNKILISPVTFWGGDTTKISVADQQMLVNFASQEFNKQLGEKFQIVTQAGPGVIKIDVALTDAETATAGLRSISIIVPQAHAVSNLKYLATGSMPFVGAAQGEVKITDSVTGQVLALAVDRQIGGGSIKAGFQWQWGDAENAIDHWAEVMTERLSAWTSGTAAP